MSGIACVRPVGKGLVCVPCARIKKKCVFTTAESPAKVPQPDSAIAKSDTVVSSMKKALGGKRKAKELSPEAIEPPSPSPVPSAFDPRPFKKPLSSSLATDFSNISSGFPPASSYPASIHASSSTGSADPTILLELHRLIHQLNASREDLAHERHGRDVDRLFYEQQIAALKEQRDQTSGWKGKGRE